LKNNYFILGNHQPLSAQEARPVHKERRVNRGH